jgi:hypothetical protein
MLIVPISVFTPKQNGYRLVLTGGRRQTSKRREFTSTASVVGNTRERTRGLRGLVREYPSGGYRKGQVGFRGDARGSWAYYTKPTFVSCLET